MLIISICIGKSIRMKMVNGQIRYPLNDYFGNHDTFVTNGALNEWAVNVRLPLHFVSCVGGEKSPPPCLLAALDGASPNSF